MISRLRLAVASTVILIHGVLVYCATNYSAPMLHAEANDPEAFFVVQVKPRLVLETAVLRATPIEPLKLSASTIIDLDLPMPETIQPLKITAGVGTLAAGPGGPNLPDSRPFAERAGLAPGYGATVVLRIEVLDDNELGQIVVEVSGGSPEIDAAAIAYARSMPWIGAVVEGKPVVMQVRYAVHLQA